MNNYPQLVCIFGIASVLCSGRNYVFATENKFRLRMRMRQSVVKVAVVVSVVVAVFIKRIKRRIDEMLKIL